MGGPCENFQNVKWLVYSRQMHIGGAGFFGCDVGGWEGGMAVDAKPGGMSSTNLKWVLISSNTCMSLNIGTSLMKMYF